MSYLNWKVGDKVVCVAADAGWGGVIDNLPSVGTTYTIRNIVICPRSKEVGIRLIEVINPQVPRSVCDVNGSTELAFRAKLFRPVQSRKTDISIFTRILRNPHVRIREDA